MSRDSIYFNLVKTVPDDTEGAYNSQSGIAKATILHEVAADVHVSQNTSTLNSYKVEMKKDGLLTLVDKLPHEERVKLNFVMAKQESDYERGYAVIKTEVEGYLRDHSSLDKKFNLAINACKDIEAEDMDRHKSQAAALRPVDPHGLIQQLRDAANGLKR